ncbi:uncharacterized protein EV154DRAFT_557458 [Mucor mucedo]|uniref:uncharacterized protein n=1 Tax=Mucor mucedo TaxID=29922 RepID=UPI002220F68A|nr:uncharacterized protein EV154DRAFT_557458 [Mucor mucedo]KAI7862881.1 hypothetical protein EV154DRAFT_557458 [Mucor mucedo]
MLVSSSRNIPLFVGISHPYPRNIIFNKKDCDPPCKYIYLFNLVFKGGMTWDIFPTMFLVRIRKNERPFAKSWFYTEMTNKEELSGVNTIDCQSVFGGEVAHESRKVLNTKELPECSASDNGKKCPLAFYLTHIFITEYRVCVHKDFGKVIVVTSSTITSSTLLFEKQGSLYFLGYYQSDFQEINQGL